MRFNINPTDAIDGVRYCSESCPQFRAIGTLSSQHVGKCFIDDRVTHCVNKIFGQRDVCPFWVRDVVSKLNHAHNFIVPVVPQQVYEGEFSIGVQYADVHEVEVMPK